MRRCPFRLIIAALLIWTFCQLGIWAGLHADDYSTDKPSLMPVEIRQPGDNHRSKRGRKTEKDGRIWLNLKSGETLDLPERPGEARLVTFNAIFPTRIELEIKGQANTTVRPPTLETYDNVPVIELSKIRANTRSSQTYYRMIYSLSANTYMLKLRSDSTPKTHQRLRTGGSYSIRVLSLTDITEQFSMSTGSRLTFRLDATSHNATRRIVVDRSKLVSFSLLGAPKSENWEGEMHISVLDGGGNFIKEVESNTTADNRYYASFVLSPQTYYLRIETWEYAIAVADSMFQQKLNAAVLVLGIDEMEDQHLPGSIKAVQTWLVDVGLGTVLEVVEFADFRNPKRGLPGANSRLSELAVNIALYRADGEFWAETYEGILEKRRKLRDEIIAGGHVEWPPGLKEAERPWLVVSFRTKQDRDTFEENESAFLKAHKVGLWERILQKISAMEGISARRIVCYVPIGCAKDEVAFLKAQNLAAREQGTRCSGVTVAIPLIATTKVAGSGLSKFATPPNLADTIPKFLAFYMPDVQTDLDFLTTEPDFVEVIVRGLRGQVVRGGADWERTQLTFVVTGGAKGKPAILRVTIDGRLASGVGTYPPDSQFTRDMEPKNSITMTEYAKRLGNALRVHILKAEPNHQRNKK